MADGKQWYNNPDNKPADTRKAAGKPVNAGKRPVSNPSGKRPVQGSSKPAVKNQGMGKPVQKRIAGKTQPVKTPSAAPVKIKRPLAKGNAVKPQTDAGDGVKAGKSIIPQVDINGKPTENKKVASKVAAKPAAKRRQVSSMERARAKEQAKIEAQERRKEEARLKEQAKIEKNEYKRKNPSQKSAESRAIRNGVLGAVAVASALFVLVFVVHHLYDYIAEKPNFSFVTTGAVEHTIGARALIVRDEDTISSVTEGELVTR